MLKSKSSKILVGILVLLLSIALIAGCGGSKPEEGSAEQPKREGFPERPVQLIVSYSAGAATDAQARPLIKYFQQEFGQPLVIVNIAGAGGTTGWNQFVQQVPDGYQMTVYNLPHIIAKSMLEDTLYSWEDFIPVVHWGFDPVAIGVLPDSPFNSIQDVVDYAKANPKSLTAGTAGLFVGQHLAILQLQQEAGIEFTTLPFPGAADAQAAIMGGQIDLNFGNLSDMYRLGDQIKILGLAAPERHEFIPDVPTLVEQGYNVIMSTDRGIAVQKDTPQEVIDILEEGFMNIMNNPEYLADMEKLGAPMGVMSGEEAKEHIANYAKKVEEILRAVGEIQ